MEAKPTQSHMGTENTTKIKLAKNGAHLCWTEYFGIPYEYFGIPYEYFGIPYMWALQLSEIYQIINWELNSNIAARAYNQN